MKWRSVPFETLYAVQSRNGVYKPSQFRGHGTRMVNMGELFGHEFIGAQDMERIDLSPGELARSDLQEGDLLFGRRSLVEAGAGKCSLVVDPPEPLTFESSIIRVRLRRDIANPRFFHYYFASPRGRGLVRTIVSGAAVKGIRGSDLAALLVDVPPLTVQDAIADVPKAYDDLVENNRRRMALLGDAARQLYREWFVRLRFPGHEHTRIIEGVPESWERIPFEEALVLQRGFDLPSHDRRVGVVPIYGSTGINGHHDKARVSGPGVVTGRSGTLGEVHYVAEDFWPLNTALWVKEFKRVTPLFSVFLMRQMNLKQYNGGVSVPTLDRKTVHRAEVLVPPRSLLNLFDDFASDAFLQIRNFTRQNENLRAARDLLLSRLMSGELVV